MNQLSNDLVVAQVAFADTAIEVSYFTKSSQAPGVQVMEVMTIDITEDLEGLAEDLLDSVRELVDEGLLLRRNPPKMLQR